MTILLIKLLIWQLTGFWPVEEDFPDGDTCLRVGPTGRPDALVEWYYPSLLTRGSKERLEAYWELLDAVWKNMESMKKK